MRKPTCPFIWWSSLKDWWLAVSKRNWCPFEDRQRLNDGEVTLEKYPHPNEVDFKRIQKKLSERCRYRYVSPEVHPIPGGYEVSSPCCSRNIDKAGGTIDIARIEFRTENGMWRLYRKDHNHGVWCLESEFGTLLLLLTMLNQDKHRKFWP
ncbi:MAG: DUF3024 domain-containing protein [Ferrovum sp.]|uniref:DUF3024 domain-containing protein n=1 Tax=Ferrovum sp. TaxID=2609467 RepID=UPI00344DAD52|nr:DUF3024 domain-containing protein [Ferrovum sp.]